MNNGNIMCRFCNEKLWWGSAQFHTCKNKELLEEKENKIVRVRTPKAEIEKPKVHKHKPTDEEKKAMARECSKRHYLKKKLERSLKC
jgi:hypothetical protein